MLVNIKKEHADLPGGSAVGSPPANSGDPGLIPGLGGLHMPGGNWAHVLQTTEAAHLEPCSAPREARALQLEKARVQHQRASEAKINIK